MESIWGKALVVATLVLVALTARRWHEAAVSAPDVVGGIDRTSAILLVRSDDCPDRREAMLRWLEEVVEGATSPEVRPMLGVLGPRATPLHGPFDRKLAELPRLPEGEVAAAERALLRAGVEGTPALLLVEAGGRVVLADHFTLDGLAGRAAVARLIAAAGSSSSGAGA